MCQPSKKSDVNQDTPEKCGEYCSAYGKEMFFYYIVSNIGLCYCVIDHENCRLIESSYYDLYTIDKEEGKSHRLITHDLYMSYLLSWIMHARTFV